MFSVITFIILVYKHYMFGFETDRPTLSVN